MKCLLSFLLAVCLLSGLAQSLHCPTRPDINVTCDKSGTQKYTLIGNKYYFASESKVNWIEAVHTCRRYGGDLATIENAAEMHAISTYLIGQHYDANHWLWISGNDLVTVRNFSSIATGMPLTYFNWSAGQPDYPNLEHCIHLWLKGAEFKMNNWQCNEKAYYLCERQNDARCWDGF
ncbi:C-type lectin 37Db-like [Drosophila busckii]|uniref:C-type lectin 37Db-like n=1 Tax=Drosophila busckii TaxID=30019 RepID=UPI00083EA298|nr:C-type lectin 37Db-like [Drosophila busckii]